MPVSSPSPLELRLSDLSTFLAIVRCGSISGAARSLQVTPSQVSKTVSRLERQLRRTLLTRGARGVAVSAAGRQLVPRFEAILAELDALRSAEDRPAQEVTIVATAFLNAAFVPKIAAALPRFRVRSIELPPGVASAYAGEHSFEAALTVGNETWPKSWQRVSVGALRRALFAPPAVAKALGEQPVAPERLAEVRFLRPIYSYHGQIVPGEDGCPLGPAERRFGHETQTVALALEIASSSEQVVFAPEVAARPSVASGRLVEVAVQGWDVRDTLYLAYDGERLRAAVLRVIVGSLQEMLEA